MSYALKNRSLLSLEELSASDVHFLLELARELKRCRRAGREQPQLRDKNIALLCDKAPTRAHSAFEIAASEQGAKVSLIGPGDAPIGAKQSVKDTARVLGRLYDAIEVRASEPDVVNELASYAGVPVWNGLTDPYHPTQILADFLTMQEHCPDRPLAQMRVAYLGDCRRTIGESLLQGAAMLGMDFRIAAPPALWPPQILIDASQERARESGARLRFTASPMEAVEDVDFICTDVWVSPQEPAVLWPERIARLLPYQVNAELLASSGNPAVKFLHGQPSADARAARIAEPIAHRFGSKAFEVTDDVVESPASLLPDQAENRLHTIKALLVATLA